MSKANDAATVSLKVMLNKQKTKVVFAEADSDFTDILFSFLTLPLGKIAKLLDDHYGEDNEAPDVGSLSNLYRSMTSLHKTHFVNEAAKQMLLNPRSSFEDVFRNLKLYITHTQPTQYFTCEGCAFTDKRSKNICVYYGTASCDECGKTLGQEISIISDAKGGDGGDFALKSATFMISDDLRVLPSETPFFQTLTDFGVNGDTKGAELMNVTFGVDENVDNLYRSLADAIDDKYFTTPEIKNRLMHPKLAPCYTSKNQFLPLFEESAPTFYYLELKLYYNQVEKSLLVPFLKSPKGPGNYVKEPTTYLVTDDLQVTSGMTMALIILDWLNIPLSDVEELEVNIGLEEAIRILKASLTSTSALSSGLINQLPKKLPKREYQLVGQIV